MIWRFVEAVALLIVTGQGAKWVTSTTGWLQVAVFSVLMVASFLLGYRLFAYVVYGMPRND